MFVLFPLLIGLAYAYGVRAHDARHSRAIAGRSVAFFGAGLLALVLALSPPVEAWADTAFTGHMAQHLLLTMIAPPLVLLGAPLRLMLSASPPTVARGVARILRSPGVRALALPAVGWLLFVIAMWTTHFSGLYEAALENQAIHVAEHCIYLGAALLFWFPIVGIGPTIHRLSHVARLLYVFLAMPQSAFLGLALYQSRHLLYPHYLRTSKPFGVSPLADQHAGGELMWIAGSFIMFAALLLVAADWARADARLAVRVDARLAASGAAKAAGAS